MPRAAVSRRSSRPSSLPDARVAAKVPQTAVACQPAAWNAPGAAMPTRAIVSYPATAAVTTDRPSRPAASPSARTVGKITAEACVMETGWVSSKSSPWANAPLASAAKRSASVMRRRSPG
jgi:hypothetical protein